MGTDDNDSSSMCMDIVLNLVSIDNFSLVCQCQTRSLTHKLCYNTPYIWVWDPPCILELSKFKALVNESCMVTHQLNPTLVHLSAIQQNVIFKWNWSKAYSIITICWVVRNGLPLNMHIRLWQYYKKIQFHKPSINYICL